MNFIVNKTKAFLSGAVVVFTGGFSIYYLTHSMYPEGPVFLMIALIFAGLFFRNASFVTVTASSVSRSFFGLASRTILWTDIRELGLIGENVFNSRKEKTGHKYIYFSPYTMTEKERFDLIVKWPPKNILYVEYREKTLEYILTIWGKDLKTYNVEDLFPNSGD